MYEVKLALRRGLYQLLDRLQDCDFEICCGWRIGDHKGKHDSLCRREIHRSVGTEQRVDQQRGRRRGEVNNWTVSRGKSLLDSWSGVRIPGTKEKGKAVSRALSLSPLSTRKQLPSINLHQETR